MRAIVASAALVLATASAAAAQRLPANVVPLHYDITIAPDLAAAKFSGEAAIRVRVEQPTRTIVLNAAELTFGRVHIDAGGERRTATVTLDDRAEQATLTAASPLPPGDAEIRIEYTGILNDDLRGLYLSEANGRRYAVTQLEATDARRMFPSFDEPAFKATFTLTAIVDAKDTAISNGAIEADTPGPGRDRHTIRFARTPKMSTYLVALAVGDFECAGTTADGIPVRVCATPDKKRLTGLALQMAKQQVEFFNRYYSIPYPFKKLDIVAVPDFASGAMENTAAIFYRESFLLADEHASVEVRKQVARVLAHEIAHQWFGNLVTMQWWDDLWLNEGFANWAMSKPVKAARPDWHVELDEIEDNHLAMGLDALRATRAVRAAASTPAEINELFDPIAYEKGAAVIRMLEAWVGEEPFRKAVNVYLERYQYGNARAEDFWRTLTNVTGKPVDRVMASFVDQPGVPLVSVDVRCGGTEGEVRLAQERYVPDGAGRGEEARTQLWQIPVCFRTAGGAQRCDVLDERTKTVALESCPAWVTGNAGARGYYRAALPAAIVRELAHDVGTLPAPERMVLLSDEWALVRAGRHDVDVLLDLAPGYRDERSTAVLSTLVNMLATIDRHLTTGTTRARFRQWVVNLLSPALARIGSSARPAGHDGENARRAALFEALGNAREPGVLSRARELVDLELGTPGSVDRTLLSVVVRLAPIVGDAALFERYLARSRSAVEPEERYRYLYGLAAFTDPALVRRTMDVALSPVVRSQDLKLLIAQMLRNAETAPLAWQLVRDRWPEIQAKSESVGNTLVVNALATFCDARRADEVEAFFSTHPVPDAERALQQAVESIRSCAHLAAKQAPRLAEWLASR